MTGRERFLTALNHGIPDRVPIFDFLNNPGIFQEAIGITPEYYMAEDGVNCASKLGLDAMWYPVGGFPAIDPPGSKGEYTDEWGISFRRDTFSWPGSGPVGHPIKTYEDLKNYSWPDPNLPSRYEQVNTAITLGHEKNIGVMAGIRGPFSTSNLLMSMQDLFMTFYDFPEMINELFEQSTNYFLQVGKRLVAMGVDALIVHEDLGSGNSTLISPAQYEEYIFPFHQRLFKGLKSYGVPVVLHSDGNINKLMNLLTSLDIDGMHPIQRGAQMDLAEIKQKWGKKLCLIGNVDASSTLAHGTKEDIEREVKECLQIAAPGGGYIMASDHSLNVGVPVENALIYLELAKKYCAQAYSG